MTTDGKTKCTCMCASLVNIFSKTIILSNPPASVHIRPSILAWTLASLSLAMKSSGMAARARVAFGNASPLGLSAMAVLFLQQVAAPLTLWGAKIYDISQIYW